MPSANPGSAASPRSAASSVTPEPIARSSRLTKVQRDVIARMRDGWDLYVYFAGTAWMTKDGEPSRHVSIRTTGSLERRGVIQVSIGTTPLYNGCRMVLV